MAYLVAGWFPAPETDYEAGIETNEKHSGNRCAYLQSLSEKPQGFGNLTQAFDSSEYRGQRLRMSVWIKTNIIEGSAHAWLRVDIGDDWRRGTVDHARFDNMDDRPITGVTDWTKCELVVDVVEESTAVVFGAFLKGVGKIWIDDFSFEVVSKDVPLTGCIRPRKQRRLHPINLSFEDD